MIQPVEKVVACPSLSKASKNQSHNMAYVEWGDPDNKQVVICVHGLARNGRDFDFLAQALASDYCVLCPDIVGRGKSDWLSDSAQYNYGTYVADMLHFMQALGLSQVHWVGTSMGGLIGMIIAASAPGMIKKLVLNDIGPFLPKEALARIGEYVGKHKSFASRKDAEAFMRDIYASWGIKKPAHFRHFLDHSLIEEADGSVRLAYDPAIGDAFRHKDGSPKKVKNIKLWWNIWRKIKCPMLVLRGGDSDVLLEKTARRMQKNKHVEDIITLPGIGHAPSLMEEEHIDTVKKFLASRPI